MRRNALAIANRPSTTLAFSQLLSNSFGDINTARNALAIFSFSVSILVVSFSIGSLKLIGTLEWSGSLSLVGTLHLHGSLQIDGTLPDHGSLYNVGTLSHLGSLAFYGTL